MALPADVALRVRGLVKRYGTLVAVDGLDLEARRGTCLGVLGPNGAGKTTTIEILEGLKSADAGQVEVLGLDWQHDARDIRKRIGVQLQETHLQDKLTARETLRLFRSFYSEGRCVDEALDMVELGEKRDARVAELSGGQRQRLALACALISRPEVLFLDEPTTGLDPQARRHVWEIVAEFKRAGGTVLLTTHYMEEAERLADELVIVDRGRVIARGTPAAIIASFGAESVVELVLPEDGAPALTESDLLALPGARGLRRDPGLVSLAVIDTQRSIAGLFALLERTGTRLVDLHTHRPTLEDVFVALTGKHLRDG